MPSTGESYYSTHLGSQIDQAYEAIEPLTQYITSNKGKIVITNMNGDVGTNNGPLLQTSAYTVDQLVAKPTVDSGKSGNFTIVDASGNVLVSNYSPSSYITKITGGQAGYLPLLSSDGSLVSSTYVPTMWIQKKSESVAGRIALFDGNGDIYCSEYSPGAVDPTVIDDLSARMTAIDGPNGFVEGVEQVGVAYQETVGPTFDTAIAAYDGSTVVASQVYADSLLVNGYTKWTSEDYKVVNIYDFAGKEIRLRQIYELEIRVAKLEAALAALTASK